MAKDGGAIHDDKSGLTVAELGAIHEFGAGVPERSFLRAWFEENQSAVTAQALSRFKVAQAGKATWQQVADQLALWAAAGVQRRIVAGIPPELAQSTIQRKGSSTPLINTGVLKSAISGEAAVL
ncbi:MAG TPA: hypothetical protein VN903_11005 [Polyangia bacterium]|nr:hypothetical protein [Polyangia bacterium]